MFFRESKSISKEFSKLVDKHGKLVYTFILDYTTNSNDIEDIYQMVWFRVYENYEKFVGKGDLEVRNYLRILTRNLIFDYFSNDLKRTKAENSLQEIQSYIEPSAEQVILNEESIKDLTLIINQLDGREQELLLLKYEYCMTSKAIGEFVGLSDSAVRMKLKRILAKIERLLKDEWEDHINE